VETDPRQLWVGPSSEAARDQAAYERSFGPFYRITQLILSSPPGGGPVLTQGNLLALFDMQEQVGGAHSS
jgi:Niemann-Pick C1 protein